MNRDKRIFGMLCTNKFTYESRQTGTVLDRYIKIHLVLCRSGRRCAKRILVFSRLNVNVERYFDRIAHIHVVLNRFSRLNSNVKSDFNRDVQIHIAFSRFQSRE